ncbi:hypothetical protein J31TS4_04240 [Paenibacillus sp. J31TS4]|uniref:Rieske (2Fe-2S) protein n=1 Tax=Paenibacillus sp. J31TS4 TaxID=2807195 RepID=UPI001B28F686|nr:Rieske 2Fe-2S domain-containing protein [Paenibacillus sp. J31TS4]GIP37144.1 hypothetical protein J31TS4_04240 [Paenibacillus sp. J31TS4]
MTQEQWIRAGTADELKQEKAKVIRGGIAVFATEDGGFAAVDNRCPHLGFPLHLGSVCEGILTCHWHHARFDVASGGTLDPWADDVPAYDVKVEGGDVLVRSVPRGSGTVEQLKQRLREGLEQNIGLVIAKAVVGLVEAGVPAEDIVRIGIRFGTSQGAGWGAGLTILTAMYNVLPLLDKTGRVLALFQGLVHTARASSGRPPRHLLGPLPASAGGRNERLTEWYRSCVEVRDTQGAEKVLLTALQAGWPAERLAGMMLAAVTDHVYLDGGHTFDFHNKAFEALALMEEGDKPLLLASLVPLLANPTRSEELHHWQAPVDLAGPLREACEALERAAEQPESENASPTGTGDLKIGSEEEGLLALLLGDQPHETLRRLTELLTSGAEPARIAGLIALAAAERIVRFHTQNDFGDWIAVLHTFTYAHAVRERLEATPDPLLSRALLHGAMAVYHDRFLNVPRAPKPDATRGAGEKRPSPNELLELLDRRQQVEEAAGWTAGYLEAGGDPAELWNALGHALLREDAEFHSFQLYEAAAGEYRRWEARTDAFAAEARRTLLLACTRYLAAHAPTARELPHTARIAGRLHRGEKLFEEQ